jgi:NAD-dependent dihydropyrimidine dehydrogenase PreA subunit
LNKALFIELKIRPERCVYVEGCRNCIRVCPVDIFAAPLAQSEAATQRLVARVVEENQDECTLCDLCLRECPTDAIELTKLY